jgi:hypothetical protein
MATLDITKSIMEIAGKQIECYSFTSPITPRLLYTGSSKFEARGREFPMTMTAEVKVREFPFAALGIKATTDVMDINYFRKIYGKIKNKHGKTTRSSKKSRKRKLIRLKYIKASYNVKPVEMNDGELKFNIYGEKND